MLRIPATAAMFFVMTMSVAAAPATSILDRARVEYDRCIRVNQKAIKACSTGGCGNILASCFQRRKGVIDADSDAIAATLEASPCAEDLRQLLSAFIALEDGRSRVRALSSSWSGLELDVSVAVLKNESLMALRQECRR